MRTQRRQRTVEDADRCGDQRLPCKVTRVGHEIARGEIVRAVSDDVVLRNQIERVAGIEPRHMRLDLHMRIEPLDRRFGAVDLAQAHIGRGVDDLTLQVGQRHRVVVDDAQSADAGRGEIQQDRRAEAAGADDQHPRGLEPGLARAADLAQHDMARITLEFRGIQHKVDPSAWPRKVGTGFRTRPCVNQGVCGHFRQPAVALRLRLYALRCAKTWLGRR